MKSVNSGAGLKVRAHKGDAMTLLAFDLSEGKTQNFTGFRIRITAGTRPPYYMTNLLRYPAAVLKKNNIKTSDAGSTHYSPIQKYRWVHVPATFHQIEKVFYGTYTYDVTPRYLVDDILQPLDPKRTVTVTIDVSPFRSEDFEIGFIRGFVASQGYSTSSPSPVPSALRKKYGQTVTQDYTYSSADIRRSHEMEFQLLRS